MKKTILAVAASTLMLVGCGANTDPKPYEDIIEKFIIQYDDVNIPEEYHEIAGGMMSMAIDELERESLDSTDFLYKWTWSDPEDNMLGLGGITLQIKSDDTDKTFSLIFN